MPRKRPPGRLTPEDQKTWNKVAGTIKPIVRPKMADEVHDADVQPKAKADKPISTPSVKPRKSPSTAPAPNKPLAQKKSSSNELDGRTFAKLRKGKIKADRRIDLHGMSAARAHAALTTFIMSAAADDCRMVLVITGKGRSASEDVDVMPRRRGVIRESLPMWLAQLPLRPLVLQHHPATDRDGGSGAFYVYLRRRRGR